MEHNGYNGVTVDDIIYICHRSEENIVLFSTTIHDHLAIPYTVSRIAGINYCMEFKSFTPIDIASISSRDKSIIMHQLAALLLFLESNNYQANDIDFSLISYRDNNILIHYLPELIRTNRPNHALIMSKIASVIGKIKYRITNSLLRSMGTIIIANDEAKAFIREYTSQYGSILTDNTSLITKVFRIIGY